MIIGFVGLSLFSPKRESCSAAIASNKRPKPILLPHVGPRRWGRKASHGEIDARMIVGDCKQILPTLEPTDAVVTSTPYADQRKKQYGGIPEADYPAFTVEWLEALRLKEHGSVAIVIREHIRNGQISDYVLRTRLAVREAGWIEAETFIWIKPDGPPLGSNYRPRRSWEYVLWFSKNKLPYVDLRANGNANGRRGFGEAAKGIDLGYVSSKQSEKDRGPTRCRDYVDVPVSCVDRDKDNKHPAQYPSQLARWLIRLLCPKDGTVIDPFAGSGSTGVAVVEDGQPRTFIGIELNAEYAAYARQRIEEAQRIRLE